MSKFRNIIPIGFRFDPSDEELINSFLLRRIMGCPLPWNGILEKDVYAAPPWIVFSDIDDSSPYWNTKRESGGAKKTIYVFTKVVKKTANSKRNSRSTGCGTWSGQTGPKIITQSAGEIVGHTKMLSFRPLKTDEKSKSLLGHWIMHEYCLSGVSLMTIGERINDVVLCKITKCIKNSDCSLVQQPAAQFCLPVIGEIRVPAAPTNYRRPAEDQQADCKRHKSCGDELLAAAQQFCSSSSNSNISISATTGNSIEMRQQESAGNGLDIGSILDMNFDVDDQLTDMDFDFNVDELLELIPDERSPNL